MSIANGRIACDGEEGLRIVSEVKPNLIITDILMPNKDGIDMIVARSQIRNEIPIIAVFGGQRVLSSNFNLSLASLVAVRSTLA